MRSQEERDILTGLLDFYSDRATAHASFAVAGTFGIYVVLFSDLPLPIFLPTYLALVSIDVYSFLNFGYYATLADIIKIKLEGEYYVKYEKEEDEGLKKRSRFVYAFKQFKFLYLKGNFRLTMFSVVFILAVLLPSIWKCIGFLS